VNSKDVVSFSKSRSRDVLLKGLGLGEIWAGLGLISDWKLKVSVSSRSRALKSRLHPSEEVGLPVLIGTCVRLYVNWLPSDFNHVIKPDWLIDWLINLNPFDYKSDYSVARSVPDEDAKRRPTVTAPAIRNSQHSTPRQDGPRVPRSYLVRHRQDIHSPVHHGVHD